MKFKLLLLRVGLLHSHSKYWVSRHSLKDEMVPTPCSGARAAERMSEARTVRKSARLIDHESKPHWPKANYFFFRSM